MANNMYDSNKPKYEWGNSWTKKGSTEKQARYIAVLIDKLAVKGVDVQVIKPIDEMTRGQASLLINELKDVGFYNSTRYLVKNCSSLIAVEN
jgi:hypothetical protein